MNRSFTIIALLLTVVIVGWAFLWCSDESSNAAEGESTTQSLYNNAIEAGKPMVIGFFSPT